MGVEHLARVGFTGMSSIVEVAGLTTSLVARNDTGVCQAAMGGSSTLQGLACEPVGTQTLLPLHISGMQYGCR